MISIRSLRLALCVTALAAFAGASSRAEETPQRPNLLVITVEGLDNVGVPAEGLEEVLFDPEIRARVTPNLERLVAKGARFEKAYADLHHPAAIDLNNLMAHARVKGDYVADRVFFDALDPPPFEEEGGVWSQSKREPLRFWIRMSPEDPSIANWERLANSLDAIATAAAVAEALGQPSEGDKPRLLVAPLGIDSKTLRLPGVFFDRFPLDQIRLPEDPGARRALAERMGAYGFDASDLSDEGELQWKRAIQAWLAGASLLDYAVGTIVDALEATDTPWAVALVASPSYGLTAEQAVGETGARAGLVLAAPGVTQPGQRVATPIELTGLERTLVELLRVDPDPLNDFSKPVRSGSETFMRTLLGESFLPLLAPAGERYDVVAITSHGDTHGVRSHRFRFIQLEDGSQQLYDLEKDPEGFYDLLDPNNAAKVERFGLTDTQVEALRVWHSDRLARRLDEESTSEEPAILPGDYNRDGRVDAADSTVWRDQNGEEVPVGSGADGDHDGRVDDEDQAIWRANYGRRATAE